MKTALPVWEAPDGWPAGSVAYLLNKPYTDVGLKLHWLVIATTYQEPHPVDPDVTRPVTAIYGLGGELLVASVSRACHEVAFSLLGYTIVDHAEGKNA